MADKNIQYMKYDSKCESTDLYTHRSAVAANDAAPPTIGSGIDCGGYNLIRLYFNVGGTTPSWKATVLFGDVDTYYYSLSPVTVSKDCYVDVSVNHERDVYVLLDNSAGTSPTVTVKYRLFNREGQ